MSFILLHHENGICGHEAALVNVDQIASVLPVVGWNKIYAQKSQACVRLTDGREMRVSERIETVMGMINASAGMPGRVEGAQPQLVHFKK
jgi:hypothetical protein